jgi:hypothetical protein
MRNAYEKTQRDEREHHGGEIDKPEVFQYRGAATDRMA